MKHKSNLRDISKMRVVVTGTRGIPDIQGGVETHCEELFPRMVSNGVDVTIVRRSCYVGANSKYKEFKGVKLKDLYAPHNKSLEAIIHTFLAIIWAKFQKADIIHIHAIGPGIMIPFAKLLGMKVVFTHHGPDYDRKKWGKLAKAALRKGERVATLHADEVIVISDVIKKLLASKYGRINTHLIFNGVPSPVISQKSEYIESLGLKSRKYVFALGRFVVEKGFDILINAFSRLNDHDFRLVVAGDSDHETDYSLDLKNLAIRHGVVLTGFVKGVKLSQLFNHAGLFVLPSFHEGMPISLLEAMSYRLPVLVSDIPANKQIPLPDGSYFCTGDEIALERQLHNKIALAFKPVEYDMSSYNWDCIAKQLIDVYDHVIQAKVT
jgi:glycosyltransferase involved in cell wall biosynthesis